MPVPRRRPPGARTSVAVLVALLAAALVACGGPPAPAAPAAPTSAGTAAFPVTIEHVFGSTTIPAAPRRMVTIGFNEADFALALGVVPVGVRDFIGEYVEESRPWAQEALGGATPEVVGGNELELEKIAALQPDVILGVYSFIDRATYERLSGIAPTVAPPSETVAATWQEQTRITGRALGMTERAEQVVADTEARFARPGRRTRSSPGRRWPPGSSSEARPTRWARTTCARSCSPTSGSRCPPRRRR